MTTLDSKPQTGYAKAVGPRRCEVCTLLETSPSHNAGMCVCTKNGQCHCRFAAARAAEDSIERARELLRQRVASEMNGHVVLNGGCGEVCVLCGCDGPSLNDPCTRPLPPAAPQIEAIREKLRKCCVLDHGSFVEIPTSDWEALVDAIQPTKS